MPSAQQIIDALGLKPHPEEGGYFHENYRSPDTLTTEFRHGQNVSPTKSLGTAIYYLLTPETCSRMHRLESDEIYHFYLGDPVNMILLYPDGHSREIILGPDILNGQQVQFVVPGNTWQGSFLRSGGQYALMGTTMAPGFDYSEYEAGQPAELAQKYPEKRDWIIRLTPQNKTRG